MAGHPRPTVRRRRVGSELKRLRERAKVRMEDAAERIGGDKSKISRQENGRQGISKLEVEALLDLYGVQDDKLRATLTALAREGRRKSWWAPFGDLLAQRFQEQLSIESDAARIMLWQPLLVPGLLQTREYAEQFIRGADRDSSDEQIESYVAVRMARQEILRRTNPPQLVCLIDEGVLHRVIGAPSVMHTQLSHLISMSNPPHLCIQILPRNQWNPGLDGAFGIFTYPDPMDLDVVAVDYLDGKLYLEEDETVDRYRLIFDELRAAALPSKDSMKLISQAIKNFDQ